MIKKWCSQSQVTSLLINVVREVVSGTYTDLERNKKLILLAFDLSEDGGMYIFNIHLCNFIYICIDMLLM